MANLQLKKTILGVVDNQLKSNAPPCTKEVYEKLLEIGYSKSESKDKIGTIVLTEIYDMLKIGKKFDEEQYKRSLEEMLQQSIDLQEGHYMKTEWDAWDEFVYEGYEKFHENNREEGLQNWDKAWEVFQLLMKQMSKKVSVFQLMKEEGFVYAIDGWLQDYEMELGNEGKNEQKITYCKKVLELFDWTNDNNESCFKCGIAESLFRMGKKEEAFEYYENWLKEEPRNYNGISAYSWNLLEHGDTQKAYAVVRKGIWELPCEADNSFLFIQAKQLAEQVQEYEECKWYQEQLDEFEASIYKQKKEKNERLNELGLPKLTPIVNPDKIYPNEPCPCGSGKKHKKCCGRNK